MISALFLNSAKSESLQSRKHVWISSPLNGRRLLTTFHAILNDASVILSLSLQLNLKTVCWPRRFAMRLHILSFLILLPGGWSLNIFEVFVTALMVTLEIWPFWNGMFLAKKAHWLVIYLYKSKFFCPWLLKCPVFITQFAFAFGGNSHDFFIIVRRSKVSTICSLPSGVNIVWETICPHWKDKNMFLLVTISRGLHKNGVRA